MENKIEQKSNSSQLTSVFSWFVYFILGFVSFLAIRLLLLWAGTERALSKVLSQFIGIGGNSGLRTWLSVLVSILIVIVSLKVYWIMTARFGRDYSVAMFSGFLTGTLLIAIPFTFIYMIATNFPF